LFNCPQEHIRETAMSRLIHMRTLTCLGSINHRFLYVMVFAQSSHSGSGQ
jgi:hypothetical protein